MVGQTKEVGVKPTFKSVSVSNPSHKYADDICFYLIFALLWVLLLQIYAMMGRGEHVF